MSTQHWMYPLGLAACLALPALTARPASAQNQEADLSVEIVRGPRVVEEDDRVAFLVEVTNHGPDTARNVRVRASGSPQLELVRARCRADSRTDDSCFFRDIEEDETVRILFVVEIEDEDDDDDEDGNWRRRRLGRFRVRADAQTFDPELEDNFDKRTLRIRRDGHGRDDDEDDFFGRFSAVSAMQDLPNEERFDGVETASREVSAPLPQQPALTEAQLDGPEARPVVTDPHSAPAAPTGAPPLGVDTGLEGATPASR